MANGPILKSDATIKKLVPNQLDLEDPRSQDEIRMMENAF